MPSGKQTGESVPSTGSSGTHVRQHSHSHSHVSTAAGSPPPLQNVTIAPTVKHSSAPARPAASGGTAKPTAAETSANRTGGTSQIGRIVPAMYENLPPVNFAKTPVNLANAVEGHTQPPPNGSEPGVSAHHGPASAHGVYSDEEDVESAASANDARGPRPSTHSPGGHHETASSVDSDDDEWGAMSRDSDLPAGSLSATEDDGLFIPEPVIQLDSTRQKPSLPYNTKEQLPIGAHVWVVDEDDVETLLNSHFSRIYEMVCNGKKEGVVLRHNGDMTFVKFSEMDSGVSCSLTMPRACLSLQPIQPYESSPRNSNRILGSYYCNVGPRATGGRSSSEKTKRNRCQQFYEVLPAMEIPKERLGDLAEAQSLFQTGSLDDALKIVNRELTKEEGAGRSAPPSQGPSSANTSQGRHPCDRPPNACVVDLLVLRSRIFIFQERYEEALKDAQRCAELEPEWIRGYLSLGRAHSALGNLTEATAAIRLAVLLLPASNEVCRIERMTRYLVSIQQSLDASGHDIGISLDYLYRKRLYSRRTRAQGSLLCAETTPIVAVTSLFAEHPRGRCTVCFRDGAEEMELVTSVRTNPINSSRNNASDCGSEDSGGGTEINLPPSTPRAYFCSRGCQQRATLYAPMEAKHREAYEHARELIRTKSSVTTNLYPLEMANMALRLFFMVFCTHRRLNAQWVHAHQPPASAAQTRVQRFDPLEPLSLDEEVVMRLSSPVPLLPVDTALKHLGIYPLVSGQLSNHSQEELAVLYAALTSDFKEEAKKLYTKQLFFNLYNYINTYFTAVDLPPSRSACPRAPAQTPARSEAKKAYYLPWLVGCASQGKESRGSTEDVKAKGGASQRDEGLQEVPDQSPAAGGGDCIPDSIGPGSGFSLAALLAADDAAAAAGKQARAGGNNSAVKDDDKAALCTEPNCSVVMSSAQSKARPVTLCHEGTLSNPSSPNIDVNESPVLELVADRAISENDSLRVGLASP